MQCAECRGEHKLLYLFVDRYVCLACEHRLGMREHRPEAPADTSDDPADPTGSS